LQENYEEIADMSRRHGLQVTSQRILIYNYLAHTSKHPSAQQVFEDVFESLPGISKATVYNTLEALFNHGLVQKINPQSGVTRYDGNMSVHSHLICTRCHRIIDFFNEDVSSLHVPESLWGGFEVTRTCVIFYGVCEECRRALENQKKKELTRKKSRVVPLKRGRSEIDAWLTMKIKD
jgi:Fur family peroxide stress response transcriptional regulator